MTRVNTHNIIYIHTYMRITVITNKRRNWTRWNGNNYWWWGV